MASVIAQNFPETENKSQSKFTTNFEHETN